MFALYLHESGSKKFLDYGSFDKVESTMQRQVHCFRSCARIVPVDHTETVVVLDSSVLVYRIVPE